VPQLKECAEKICVLGRHIWGGSAYVINCGLPPFWPLFCGEINNNSAMGPVRVEPCAPIQIKTRGNIVKGVQKRCAVKVKSGNSCERFQTSTKTQNGWTADAAKAGLDGLTVREAVCGAMLHPGLQLMPDPLITVSTVTHKL
jgi:hypothetical protein